jgi:hypothetical protein
MVPNNAQKNGSPCTTKARPTESNQWPGLEGWSNFYHMLAATKLM